MASSFIKVKNNVDNFINTTTTEGCYRLVGEKVKFVEDKITTIPGTFYTLVKHATKHVMVEDGELIMGFSIKSSLRDNDDLSAFAYCFYNDKLYTSKSYDYKSFNKYLKSFNRSYKSGSKLNSEKAFSTFTEAFGCINNDDVDLHDMIVDKISNEVSGILDDYEQTRFLYFKEKCINTDIKIAVKKEIDDSEEQKEVDRLKRELTEAVEKLKEKKLEVEEKHNKEIHDTYVSTINNELRIIDDYYKDSVANHISSMPVPQSMALRIERNFSAILLIRTERAREKHEYQKNKKK